MGLLLIFYAASLMSFFLGQVLLPQIPSEQRFLRERSRKEQENSGLKAQVSWRRAYRLCVVRIKIYWMVMQEKTCYFSKQFNKFPIVTENFTPIPPPPFAFLTFIYVISYSIVSLKKCTPSLLFFIKVFSDEIGSFI